MAAVSEALRFRFSPDKLKFQGYKRHPHYGFIRKRTDWTEDSLLHQVYHSGGRGKGTTISVAQANQTASGVARFTIDRKRLYSVAEIEREYLKASSGSMLEGKMALIQQRAYECMRDISRDLFRDASGSLGVIGAVDLNTPGAGTDRITLADPEDVVHFEKGMFIGATTGSTATAAIRDDDQFEVSGVDRSNGYIYVLGNTETGSAWAAGDHLIENGDEADGSSTKKLDGMGLWIPAAAPVVGADSFLGVDRGVDVTRLAGQRFAGETGQSALECLVDAGTICAREGGSPEVCFVNPVIRAEVAKHLHGQSRYEPTRVGSTDARVFYDGFVVETGAGPVALLSDPDCPVDTGWMVRRDAYHLRSLGEAPELVDEDGLTLQRVSDDDAFEVRFAAYLNLVVDEPQEMMRITFAA